MFELIDKGGQLMWLIMACSVVAFAVALERFLHFLRCGLDVGDFMKGIALLVSENRVEEALRESRAAPGPVARVVQAALSRPHLPRSEMRDVVREAGQIEVARLENHLPVLATIAMVAPLIGFLGTLLGLIDTFIQVSEVTGYATPVELSRGVYQSLITSAGGLAVAVPSYILFAYLATRAKHLMHDMERAGIETINLLCDSRAAAVAGPASAEEK